MSHADVFDVADFFLRRVDTDAGSVMTHLKLQKLVYYAQAWHLVWQGEPLVDEEFEAWVHGPVSRRLWERYREHGFDALPIPTNSKDWATVFSAEQLSTLHEIWDAYGRYDAKYLEELTHQEQPWMEAREQVAVGAPSTAIISRESMVRYYASLSG